MHKYDHGGQNGKREYRGSVQAYEKTSRNEAGEDALINVAIYIRTYIYRGSIGARVQFFTLRSVRPFVAWS